MDKNVFFNRVPIVGSEPTVMPGAAIVDTAEPIPVKESP